MNENDDDEIMTTYRTITTSGLWSSVACQATDEYPLRLTHRERSVGKYTGTQMQSTGCKQ